MKRQARPVAAQPFGYLAFYRAATFDRIKLIKAGIPARTAKAIIGEMQVDQQTMFSALNIKTATINRKAAQDGVLSGDESERVLGIAKLLGQLEAIVEESGDITDFDARAWLSRWLREPLPALGGTPIALLDTMEGQALIARTLAQMQSGAYA